MMAVFLANIKTTAFPVILLLARKRRPAGKDWGEYPELTGMPQIFKILPTG